MTNGVTSVGHPEEDEQYQSFKKFTARDGENYHAEREWMAAKCEAQACEERSHSSVHFTLLNALERLIKNDISLPAEFGEWDFEKQCAFINDTNSVPHFEIGGELRHQVKALEIEILDLKKELDFFKAGFSLLQQRLCIFENDEIIG